MATESHREHLGEHFSEGARLLWEKLPKLAREWGVRPGSVREELTRRLGAARGTVSRYLYGDRKPDRVQAVQLQKLAGIPLATWEEAPKTRFSPPAATGTDG